MTTNYVPQFVRPADGAVGRPLTPSIKEINRSFVDADWFNVTPDRLKNWRVGTANVRRNSANSNVVLLGDSTTAGRTDGGGTAQVPNSYGAQLAAQLTSSGLTSSGDSCFPTGIATADSRLTLTSFTDSVGLWQATASASMAFTPTRNVDTFDVYFFDNGTMRFSDQVDSGGVNSPAASAVPGIKKRTVSTTLGAHTLNLAWITGSVRILGIDAYNSAVKQVSLWNLGVTGTQASFRTTVDGIYSGGDVATYFAALADLTIIDYGINEGRAATSVATFSRNIQTLINIATAGGGDVILKTPVWDSATYTGPAQTDYVNAVKALAVENDIPLIDVNGRWVSYTSANALGFYSDNVHPTALGYSDVAATVRRALMSVI